MKKINIGLMGCTLNNPNLGCAALTFSLLTVLEKIAQKKNIEVKYCFFCEEASSDEIKKIADELEIEKERIELSGVLTWEFYSIYSALRTVRWIPRTYMAIKELKKCNFIIDLTQGDSFTDIYGEKRFYRLSANKRLVELIGTKLILGPQTYGPFEDRKIKRYVKKIIERANIVIARDEKSKIFLEEFCDKNILVATDLAFRLPYIQKKEEENSSIIKIGINPSGLLCKKKTDGSEFDTILAMDFDDYLLKLINWLKEKGNYEIHLIPHVGNEAIDAFPDIENVIYHKQFSSPIQAKSLISNMDIFLGARMHATIAAFSSGVATIPLAYSRKFAGLFENIGYNYTIDLQKLDESQALDITKQYIEEYKKIKQEIPSCMNVVNEKYKVIENTFWDLL